MIIGLAGKKGSGKDTVAKLIQILTMFPKMTDDTIIKSLKKDFSNEPYEIVRFADKLKDFVCSIIGCIREQLEDRDFKETELGEEWVYYKAYVPSLTGIDYIEIYGIFATESEALNIINQLGYNRYKIIGKRHSPRTLMQMIGTEAGREIIHPNIWVNATMVDYKAKSIDIPFGSGTRSEKHYPKWIIPDVRFPNEVEAITKRNGLKFKVVNPNLEVTDEHESETALDNYNDYHGVIMNDSDYYNLINQVKTIILKDYNLI